MSILEEDRWTSVAALDRAVQIVPFVNPADWCGRFTPLIPDWLFACYFLKQVKRPIQSTLRLFRLDKQVVVSSTIPKDPITFRAISWRRRTPVDCGIGILPDRVNDDCIVWKIFLANRSTFQREL